MEQDALPIPSLHSQPGISAPVECLRSEENKADCKSEAICPIALKLSEIPVEQSVGVSPEERTLTNAELDTIRCPESTLANDQRNITEVKMEDEAAFTVPAEGSSYPVDSEKPLCNLVKDTSDSECDQSSPSYNGEHEGILESTEELHPSQECALKCDLPEMLPDSLVIGNPDEGTIDSEKSLLCTEMETAASEGTKSEEAEECAVFAATESAPADGHVEGADCQGEQLYNESTPFTELLEEATVGLELEDNRPRAETEGSQMHAANEVNAGAGCEVKPNVLDEVCAARVDSICDSDDEFEGVHHRRSEGDETHPPNPELPCSLNTVELERNDTTFDLPPLDEQNDAALKVLPFHKQCDVISEVQSLHEENNNTSEQLPVCNLESEPEQHDDQMEADCPCDDEWSKQVDALLETASDSSLGEDQALPKEVQAMEGLKEEVSSDEGAEEVLPISTAETQSTLPASLEIPLNEDHSPDRVKKAPEFLRKSSDAVLYSPSQEVLLSIVEEPADYMINSSSDSEDRFEECGKPSPEEELKEDAWVMEETRSNVKDEVLSPTDEKSDTISLDTKVSHDSTDWAINTVLDANGNLEPVDLKGKHTPDRVGSHQLCGRFLSRLFLAAQVQPICCHSSEECEITCTWGV